MLAFSFSPTFLLTLNREVWEGLWEVNKAVAKVTAIVFEMSVYARYFLPVRYFSHVAGKKGLMAAFLAMPGNPLKGLW